MRTQTRRRAKRWSRHCAHAQAPPMSAGTRAAHYRAANGNRRPAPAQLRRLRHKGNREISRARVRLRGAAKKAVTARISREIEEFASAA